MRRRQRGFPVASFRTASPVSGVPVTVATLAVAALWLWVRTLTSGTPAGST